MKARAPGKIVLSGAYSVLEGAPAIVAAVDRYVTADGSLPSPRVTEEVRAAIEAGALAFAPWFDASELRASSRDGRSRKLGLGSSAAILVASLASLASLAPRERVSADAMLLQKALFAPALAAHRAAQPGGSGIDVAASVLGGVLRVELRPGGELHVTPHALPADVVIEVFASPVEASTSKLVERVRALAASTPALHRQHLDAAWAGARAAVAATSAPAFVAAVDVQIDALGALGDAAGAGILTPRCALRPAASVEAASFGPSGAGGGDIALYVGAAPSSLAFRRLASAHGLALLGLRVGAPGVYVVD